MSATVSATADYRFAGYGRVGEGADRYDRIRPTTKIFRSEEPGREVWVVLDHHTIRSCLQDSDTFSSEVVTPLMPDPPMRMIPIQLDPPEHTIWRRLLAGYFSPRTMAELKPKMEDRCRQLISEIVAQGRGDVFADFCQQFPTAVFLEMMGLPVERLPEFLEWEHQILLPPKDGEIDMETTLTAIFGVCEYFATALAERGQLEVDQRPPGLLSDMLLWDVEGERASVDDLVNCCLLLFMAGLDTVANSLAFGFHHLATNPASRAEVADIVASGSAIAPVVEEILRYFAVPELGRKVVRDVEVGGVTFRAGDLVVFPLVSANRDPDLVEDADKVRFDRPQNTPHIAFGAGAHRCLGSHLARIEMAVALEEWHRQIPDYDIAGDVEAYWSSTHGVRSLPITIPGRN